MKINKQWRSLIVFGAIIITLLLVWIGSSLIPGRGNGDTTSATTTAVPEPLFQTEMTDIAWLEIVNEQITFTLVPEEVTDKDGKVALIWTVDGKEDYPFSSSAVENLARVAGYVFASREIATDATDLAPYGLDQPNAIMRVILKNGTTHEIKFGREIPSGYYDYATLDDTGRICTVASNTANRVRSTLLDLLDKNVMPNLDPEELSRLEFTRARDRLRLVADIKLVGQAGSGTEYFDFTITEPVHRTGSSEALSRLVDESVMATVVKFIELDPQDLTIYGLDQPAYSFTLVSGGEEVRLMIGNKADSSNFYAMTDQVPAVFTVAASGFSTIDMKVTEMMDRFVALQTIWEVSKIEVDILGTQFVTEISMERQQKAEDESVVYKINGENAKIFSETKKSLYSQFYQRIIGILIEGLDTEAEPVNTRDVRLVYHIKADEANNVPAYTKVVEFARRDDYTYYVFVDGIYGGYYVDGERAFTSTRKDNEGLLVAYKMIRHAMDQAVDGIFNTTEGYPLD